MKIFLTGASGFIGRNILEQLHGRYTFFAPMHKELDLTDALAVAKYLELHQVDVVIHTANIGCNRAETDTHIVVSQKKEYYTEDLLT